MQDLISSEYSRKTKLIYIKSSKIIDDEVGQCKLVFNIEVNDRIHAIDEQLVYTIDKKYKDFICSEVVDGVIVTLLPYALRGGFDIKSNIPMTEQLYYTITSQLIPQLMTCNELYHSSIKTNTVCPCWEPTAVATAMSLGVDSLATFFEYSQSTVLSDYRITHLTFFENGAHHGGKLGHSKREKIVFNEQANNVRSFCKKMGYDLIEISSNLDEFLNDTFGNDPYDRTHTYRNIGFVLLLQKLIRVYYCSPAYSIKDFSCLMEESSAHYEAFLLPNISSKYTRFYNSDVSMTRLEKIKYLSHFPETYDSLLVCYADGNNCGECIKCKRTQVEMDILGVLSLYEKSFDLKKYSKNRRKCFVYCLSKRKKDILMYQIHEYIKENNVKIPVGAYLLSDIRMIAVELILYFRRNKSKLKK